VTSLQADNLIGATAVDSAGDKIGKVGQVYLDDQSGQPAWVTVSTGLFGTRESFAPLYGASRSGEDLVLQVSKGQVKQAPNVDNDGHVNGQEQRALYDHYAAVFGGDAGWQGWQAGESGQDAAGGQPGGPVNETGPQASGSGTEEAMTRSEQQIRVGTEPVESGRARLRKYVVTENVTQTVPVSHEEVRVEREPITDANASAATDGPAISEAEHEVTLHAERPVVDKETVPVERVRMDTETVTDQHTVDDTVRKEQIELEDDENATGTSGPRRQR
jgi:uncharacterized protein (TIGR02271 family)